MDIKHRPVKAAVNCVQKAIEQSIEARPLNALITETFHVAREQRESAMKSGLDTFPVVVKDCFAVENIRMTCASSMLENYIAPYTATCVQRLINRGGCVVGKANMDEFAMGSSSANSHFGAVRHFSHHFLNRLNLQSAEGVEEDFRIAGGSSGGCAVAVALGMARMALGSDTGGSTRNPAAFNGIFGFKPSYGALSRHGLVPLANSFDAPSIFALTPEDCQHFFDMMRGHDCMDSTSIDSKRTVEYDTIEPRNFTIGIPKEYRNALKLSKEAENAWDTAANVMRSLDFNVIDVSLPYTDVSIVCYHILAESDIASNMGRYDGIRFGHRTTDRTTYKSFNELITTSRTEALKWEVKRRILAGNFYNIRENKGIYYHQAAKVRRLIKQDFDRVFTQVDGLLTPTTSHSAPMFSETLQLNERQRKDDYFTQPANMAGLPAISIPISHCSHGQPLAVQIMCDFLKDDLCLAFAKMLYNNKDK